MKIIDEDFLEQVRRRPACEFCGRRTRNGLDAHHFPIAKGMGNGSQLDHPWNLMALCRKCHTSHHAGNQPTRDQLYEVLECRELVTRLMIWTELNRILRLQKGDRL